MIIQFEYVTYNISDFENDIMIPALINILKNHEGKNNAITSAQLIKELLELSIRTSDVRLRKCIKAVQLAKTVKWIVATQSGFFYTTDIEDIKKQIQSLRGREVAIRDVRYAFEQSISN